MLNGSGVEFIGQCLEHGLARGAIVREDAHFDQTMGVECQIDLFFDGTGEPVAADHHDGVKMMGIGSVFFTLGRSQLN